MVYYYVIHEYERYNCESPTHAWEVVGKYNTEKEAQQVALDMNFKEFCENKPYRWSKEWFKKKVTSESSNSDKVAIVKYVIENIHNTTGARKTNQYWGRGYFSLGDDSIKLRHNTKKIENIKDYLIIKERDEEVIVEEDAKSDEEFIGGSDSANESEDDSDSSDEDEDEGDSDYSSGDDDNAKFSEEDINSEDEV